MAWLQFRKALWQYEKLKKSLKKVNFGCVQNLDIWIQHVTFQKWERTQLYTLHQRFKTEYAVVYIEAWGVFSWGKGREGGTEVSGERGSEDGELGFISVTSSSLFMGNECCCLCMFCDIFTFYGKWMLLSMHVLSHLLHFLCEMNAAVCACSVTSSSLFMGNECCCLCMFCHIFWLFVKQLLLSVRHCSGCWLGDREAWSDDLRGQNLQQLLGRKQTETVHSYCPDWKPPDHLFGEWFSRFHLVPGEFCLGHIILNIPDLLYPDPFVSQLQC